MRDTHGERISVSVPDELGAAVGMLRSATGRDDYDIVTSALRTYLADERQRKVVIAHFHESPIGYPAAYVVTLASTLLDSTVWAPDAKARAESTFGQINRFTPTRLEWSPDRKSVVVQLAVSGQTPAQAAETAVKMVRQRFVDELHIATQGGLSVEIIDTYDLLSG